MKNNKNKPKFASALLLMPGILSYPILLQAADPNEATTLADVVVSEKAVDPADLGDLGADGRPEPVSKTNISAPITKVTRAEIDTTNAVTTQDSIKFESGVFSRQRYIGDPNSPVGMRGSNPYVAGRVIVNMDGMPIWNPLQSSFNGSPRWSLIGPGEIKSVDVSGGPFSAEYSGNAMGGVINFNTRMPQKREVYTEATYMLQPYDQDGTNRNLQGFKTFISYGDKIGEFSTFFSYNHLENEGQPMQPLYATNSANVSSSLPAPTLAQRNTLSTVNGAVTLQNPKGNGTGGNAGATVVQYGTDGVYHSTGDLYKWKGGFQIKPELDTNFLLAYENLEVLRTGVSMLRNAAGRTVYPDSGSFIANGYVIPSSTSLGQSQQSRETLTMGWGLNGRLFGNWFTNTNLTYFDILKDTTLSSTYNPNDPIYATAAGQVGQNVSWDNSGWFNLSSKFNNDEFLGNKDLSFATGYEYQHSSMYQTTNSLSSYANNLKTSNASLRLLTGGVTDTHALFGQLSWRFLPDWDATPGVRLERWNMSDGKYLTNTNLTGGLNPADRQSSNWSPKFSIGYQPGNWKFRYSVAKAYRYPVADELFGNSNSVSGSSSLANSTLKPEDGTHHNLLGEYDFSFGYARLNLFHENIRNAIYTQYIYLNCLNNVGTCPLSSMISSIGEVETDGADITTNFDNIFKSNIDVKLNTTILNSKIISNPANPSLVGHQMPLLPHYRANLLTTYHYGQDWDFSVATRYNSEMYSQPDNKDQQIYNYGAFTAAYYVDLKATYRFLKGGHVSAGIDNLNGYGAYFNHPLPLRTFFAQVGYKF